MLYKPVDDEGTHTVQKVVWKENGPTEAGPL
jgi:hypothetical protein